VLYEFGEEGSRLLAGDGILIAEHHAKTNLPDVFGKLRRWRILKQGENPAQFL